MPPRCRAAALLPLLLAGCVGGPPPAPRPYLPPVPPRGVVFAVEGAGGYGGAPQLVADAVADAGLPLAVEPVVWTHGHRRFVADVVDAEHLDCQGRRLAAEVRAWQTAHPGLPVYVVGHSAGCGVALRAAEDLPADSLARVVLIAPAVSAGYDLRPALRASRALDVFYSDRDWLHLSLGTGLIGTTDRRRDAAAGRVGFRVQPRAEDACLYERLRQHPWDPAVAWTGHEGGHSDAFQPAFLRAYVVPLLTP